MVSPLFLLKKRQHPKVKAAPNQQTYSDYLTVMESSVTFVTVFLAPG